jgi:hypothetical protein
VTDDSQMWKLRHGFPAELGRQYTSLSCLRPDHSASNQQDMG